MKFQSYFGPAGGGASDVVALPGNMRRKSLVITYGGAGNLLVSLGNRTNNGTDADFVLSASGGPLVLNHDTCGDALTAEVHIWNSAASSPVTVTEFFES